MLGAAIVLAALAGCAAPGPTVGNVTARPSDESPISPQTLAQLPAGRYCNIETLANPSEHAAGYSGRIIRVTGSQITLAEAEKHTDVGTEQLDGEQAVLQEHIATVTLLDDESAEMYCRRRSNALERIQARRTDATGSEAAGAEDQSAASRKVATARRKEPLYAD